MTGRGIRTLCLTLALCLALCAIPASAAGDSLATEDDVQAWAEDVLSGAVAGIAPALSSAASDKTAGEYVLSDGDYVTLRAGASALLISGNADISVSGTVVNATSGALASSGRAGARELYIVAGSSSARITAEGSARIAVWGGASMTKRTLVFSDVPEGSWYCDYVYSAVAVGLIDGVTETSFEPESGFTAAQAVKIAACLHQYYHTGAVTLTNGAVWYQPYIEYAVANGIAGADYASMSDSALNEPINRRDFAVLFYNAMPSYEYTVINDVETIPDVAQGDEGAAEIYALYRAGILDGKGYDGSYEPESGIRRSEAAAILARMLDESLRIHN